MYKEQVENFLRELLSEEGITEEEVSQILNETLNEIGMTIDFLCEDLKKGVEARISVERQFNFTKAIFNVI